MQLKLFTHKSSWTEPQSPEALVVWEGAPSRLAIFVIFRQIIAVLAQFRSHFAGFSELFNGIKFLKFGSLLKEINSPTHLATLLAGKIQNKFERLHLGVKWLG